MRFRAIVAAACVCGCARSHASAPAVVVPRRQPPGGQTSGTPPGRGDVELGLGAVTAAVAAVLVGVGSYEAWRGVQVRSYCRRPDAPADPEYGVYCTTPLGGDPFVAAVVSSTLSLTFAVPIAVASGFLLRRGVTLRRAWRTEQVAGKMSLQPWSIGQHGAGLSFGLRF
jgi:hypothetical protein